MSRKDTITKEYMSKREHFADAFNSCVFDGKQVVKADELSLQEKDPTELGIVFANGEKDVVQKLRDVLKKGVIMSSDKMTFLLLGIENQSEVHYAMPVRNLLYDALNYRQQVSEIAAEHRKEKDLRDAEFLSGFSKEDKIIPVITLTVYFGSDKWDGPRSLKEMFPKDIGEEVLRKVDDYHLHLIIPTEIKDFSKFKTELGKAMKYIAVSEDKEAMKELAKDEDFKEIGIETVRLINECTGSNIDVSENGEVVNMCKGLEDWINDVTEEKNAKFLVKSVENIVKNLNLNLETACNALGSSVQAYEDAKVLLKSIDA